MAGAMTALFQPKQTASQIGWEGVLRIGRHIRYLLQDALEIILRGAPGPPPEEDSRSLHGTDLLRDRGRDPLVERYAVLLGETCRSRLDRGRKLERVDSLAHDRIASKDFNRVLAQCDPSTATALGWPVRSISRCTRRAMSAGTRVRWGPSRKLTIPAWAKRLSVRDRLASLRPVSAASSRTEPGSCWRMAASMARLPGESSFTMASAETCSAPARCAVSSLSNQVFGTPRPVSESRTTRRVHSANSPMEPIL